MFVIYDKETGRILGISSNSDNPLSDNTGLLEIDEQITCDGYYIEKGSVIKMPAKPGDNYFFDYMKKKWVVDTNQLIASINFERHELLLNSDWTDTVSAQTRLPNYQQWQDYRQALRDIPQQTGYPENVIWPEQPQ